LNLHQCAARSDKSQAAGKISKGHKRQLNYTLFRARPQPTARELGRRFDASLQASDFSEKQSLFVS
jgi:hypothetical protein